MTRSTQSPLDVGELVGAGFFVELGFGFGSRVEVGSGSEVDVGLGADVEVGAGAAVELAVDVEAGAGALLVGTSVGEDVASTTVVAGAAVLVVPAVVLVGRALVELEEDASPHPASAGVLPQSPPGNPGKAPDDMASSRQLSPDQKATALVARTATAARTAAMTSFRRGFGAFVEERVSVDMAHQGRGTAREAPVVITPTTVVPMPGETRVTTGWAR